MTVLELDRMLAASIQKKKFELIAEMMKNDHFLQFIELAQGADNMTNLRLAQAIIEAGWNNLSATPIIKKYAETYIDPQRKKRLS